MSREKSQAPLSAEEALSASQVGVRARHGQLPSLSLFDRVERHRVLRVAGVVLALAASVLPQRVAAAADTHMVVPSRSTAAVLDALSYKSNVVADVLTVDRKDYVLEFDGSGGGAFSGKGVSALESTPQAEPSAIHIPLDQVALVYYREQRVGKKEDAVQFPRKETYPAIAAVGTAERSMDCSELNREIARAGTIRWYARRLGVVPFTDREARAQHGKNAAKDVGWGLLTVLALAVGGFPRSFTTPHLPVDLETFRWAVTAADRREVGLLKLKRDQLCPASATLRGESTDLEILTTLEATLKALDAHEISDTEQMRHQTQLLDQFDPVTAVGP